MLGEYGLTLPPGDGTLGRIAQGGPPEVAEGSVGGGLGEGKATALAEASVHAGPAVELVEETPTVTGRLETNGVALRG